MKTTRSSLRFTIIIASIMILTCVTALTFGQNPIFNAFKQGPFSGTGNCASVAVIKATIDKYGTGNVFKIIKGVGNQTHFVKLKSGEEFSITEAEMNKAISSARFVQKDLTPAAIDIKTYADTCFAVICKNLQLIRKYKNIERAVYDLNDGFKVDSVAFILGVNTRHIRASRRVISASGSAVMYNVNHAAYTSNGLYDEAGGADGITRIGKFKTKQAGWKCGFIFCRPCGALEIK
jgi:hypothetical protein